MFHNYKSPCSIGWALLLTVGASTPPFQQLCRIGPLSPLNEGAHPDSEPDFELATSRSHPWCTSFRRQEIHEWLWLSPFNLCQLFESILLWNDLSYFWYSEIMHCCNHLCPQETNCNQSVSPKILCTTLLYCSMHKLDSVWRNIKFVLLHVAIPGKAYNITGILRFGRPLLVCGFPPLPPTPLTWFKFCEFISIQNPF